jgi:hypothetical protein
MRVQDRSWPHPVLAVFRDDVAPNDFSFEFQVRTDKQNFYLEYEIFLSHPGMEKLLEEKTAMLAMHIECRRNFYRVLRTLPEMTGKITVPAAELRGRTELFCCVLAAKDIDSYSIDGQHSDYGTTTFRVQQGDFLAVTESRSFEAFFDFDPLKKISSILNIRRSKTVKEGPMEVILGEQKLVAELSQADYERYVDLRGDTSIVPLLSTQVVVPALMEAVSTIRNLEPGSAGHQEHMELRWFRSLSMKLTQLGIDVAHSEYSTTRIVQTVIEMPLRRSLEGLIAITSEGAEK